MDIFEKIDFSDEINKIFDGLEKEMRLAGDTEEEIQQFFNDEDGIYSDMYNSMLTDFLDAFSEEYLVEITKHINKCDADTRQGQTKYRKEMEAIWGRGFAWLRLYHSLTLDVIKHFEVPQEKPREVIEAPNKETTLYRLNTKALLFYAEIICLLENCFPDGALAHYRNLYELWVITEFLYHDSDEVSLAYLESSNKKATQARHHYSWAKTSERMTGVEDISFHGIMKEAHKTYMQRPGEKTSLKKLESNYNFLSVLVHPNARGLELMSESFPNAKTVGIANPAISASIKMNEINLLYLSLFASSKSAYICSKILDAVLSKKIIPIFNEIEHGDSDVIITEGE